MSEAFMRGMLIPLDGGGETVMFQWNPDEISGADANPTYATLEVLGRELPVIQYTSGGNSTISFKVKASRKMSESDVKDLVDKLLKLTKPEQSGGGGGGGQMPKPPRCSFVFGQVFENETVYVQSVKPVLSRMVSPLSLQPTHGEIQITLLRIGDEQQ